MITHTTLTFEVTPKLVKRFFKKVNKDGPIIPYVGTPCWIWIAGKNDKGYGGFSIQRRNRIAPRVSWIIHNGPIPEGMLICHKCDNPPCVNPDHLFIGTRVDNSRDMVQKGRYWTGGRPPLKRGATNGNSKITQDIVDQLRALHATGQYTQRALAKIFSICQTQVRNIVNLKQWVN